MRFLVRFSLGLLLSVSLALLLLYASTAYADLAARVALPNYALPTGQANLPLTTARYQALRGGLVLVAGAAGLGALVTMRWPTKSRGSRPRRSRGAWLLRPALSQGEWLVAGAVLGGAAVLRLWFAVHYPLTLDELASYDYAVLPGAGIALAVGFGRQPRRLQLQHLAMVALGVGVVVAVLYAPVVAVSGWPALVANPYVERLSAPDFWTNLDQYLLGTASELLGRREASAGLFVLVAGLTPWVLWRGRVPEPARRLGWVAYVQLMLWLPLIFMQRVYPPARTLLAVPLVLLMLATLVGHLGWQRVRSKPAGVSTPGAWLVGLLVGLSSYGSYRLYREQLVTSQQYYYQQQLEQACQWLQARPPRCVWVSERQRAVAIFWHHYALATGVKPLPLVLVEAPAHAFPMGPGDDYELLPGLPVGQVAAYAKGPVVLVRHPVNQVP